MSLRSAHRRRVIALEDAAAAMMLTALDRILAGIAQRFAALTADANPAEARGSVDDAAQVSVEWQAAVHDEVLPWFAGVYRAGAAAAEAQVLGLGIVVPDPLPEQLDLAAVAYLEQAQPRLFALGDDAWAKAHEVILEGFQAGDGIDTMRARIRDVTDLARHQADALARTEVIAASNMGALARVDLMGDDAPTYKQWLATLDTRTRPTHRHADGQVVPRGTPFEVGGASLTVPGDPTGPAAEVINCRCTTLFVDTADGIDPDTPGRGQGGIPVVTAAAAGPNGPPQVDTATGEPHTGAMIALVPADPEQLALGHGEGEPPEALHLTLGFLGEAADMPSDVFTALLAEAEQLAVQLGPIESRIFGAAAWNTTSDNPSLVLNIGDPPADPEAEPRTLQEAHLGAKAAVIAAAAGSDWAPPAQHSPWVAHVCLGYGDPQVMSPAHAALAAEGPIVFDRLRVTSGPDAYDFPLGGDQPPQEAPMDDNEARAIGQAVGAAVSERLLARTRLARGGVLPATRPLEIKPISIRLPAAAAQPAPAPQDCPPGQHPMPDGTCMPDDQMPDGPPPQPGEHLRARMHVRGEATGAGNTGRKFINTDYRTPPFSFNYQVTSSAHGGTPEVVHIGNVVRVVEAGPTLYGFVTLDLGGAQGMEYARRAAAGIERWVSMGLDETVPTKVTLTLPPEGDQPLLDAPAEPSDQPVELELMQPLLETIDGGRILELTGVSVPAQADATIEPTPELLAMFEGDGGALVASVVGAADLPIADRGHSWDGAAATGRVFDLYTNASGDVDTAAVARAFLYRNPDADPATKGAYKLGFADVVNGQLQLIPAGLAACAGGRGVDAADIPSGEKDTIKRKICTLYGKVQAKFQDWPDCPFAGSTTSAHADCGCGGTCGGCGDPSPADFVQALTAASMTITLRDLPPAAWFQEPDAAEMQGALMLNDHGRVWGLLAPLGTGHRAFVRSGRRVEAPSTNVDYDRFLGGWALTDEGRIPAGNLTMDCGHAPRHRADHDVAPEHYENTCSVFGKVNVGFSARLGGVWIAGALEPGTTPDRLSRALACRCSGDWQPHPDRPGWQELVAALLVPVPGFGSTHPQAASATFEAGVLVASSAPVRFAPARAPGAHPTPLATAVRLLADHAGRTAARRVRDAAARVH